ncbi:MAG: ABC transporter ATP-binding protein [Candidatus Limnocylindrales bacterium]|jgi:ABC-2 type transport system ATP-binding protein
MTKERAPMLLEIHDLTKTYRRRLGRGEGIRANDGIHLRADSGQVYGLLGHNGAGKTTLVNQVVGLLQPDAGRIEVDGADLVADPGHARRVCSLQPQAQLPIDGLTPRQAIDLLGQLRGGRAADVRARRERLVDALDIGAWLDTDGERLSGGVKRLVSFAMAAVVPGRVVVLDEPTNDVDPIRRRLLWSAVRSLADEGNAVLLVTHNVVEAEKAVDRLAILDAGRVVAEGSPAQLKSGLEHELRLDLSLEPGLPAPPIASFALRYQANGSRARAIVEAGRAAEAIGWAQTLRSERRIGEFALTPASLEDVYVDLVSAPSAGRSAAAPAVSTEEVSHVSAA